MFRIWPILRGAFLTCLSMTHAAWTSCTIAWSTG